jgi:hypothetical protein
MLVAGYVRIIEYRKLRWNMYVCMCFEWGRKEIYNFGGDNLGKRPMLK